MNTTLLQLALLGAFAKNGGKWFRQKDVRAAAEHLWTIAQIHDDLTLHNTQILRQLEGLCTERLMDRKSGPEYVLSPQGCLQLIYKAYKTAAHTTNFQEFLLVHYFLSSTSEILLKIHLNDPRQSEFRKILNSRQLIQDRLNYLNEVEARWEKRLSHSVGLIAGEQAKKLWTPTLEEVKYQKQILSQF